MKKFALTSIIALLFLISITNGIAQPSDEGDNIFVENDNIAFNITGNQNVPMYSFWLPSQIENKYLVKFIHLFEIIDVNQDGVFDHVNDSKVPTSTIALPSMVWNFSEIITLDTTTHFNITGRSGDLVVQFRNHIDTDASLKFDIVIENYDFISDSDDAMLVLGFHLIAVGNDQDDDLLPENQINFGEEGYIETEPTAEASGETIEVGVSDDNEGGQKVAYIAYERFTGTLVHDPTLGIESTGTSIPGYNLGELISISFIAIGISILLIRRKYKK